MYSPIKHIAHPHIRKFNYRLLAYLCGMLLLILSGIMLLPIGVSIYCQDGATIGLITADVCMLFLGLLGRNILGDHHRYDLHEKESFWITTIAWLIIPLAGTLPYLCTGTLPCFSDAAFESFSGFTTTGSSVIRYPESVPVSVMCWRSITQWIGGLGLILFLVAIFRRLNVGSIHLYDAEFSGTIQRKLHPHIATTVGYMWTVYLLLTIILFVGLLLCGNHWSDAFCLSLSTVSTGGFMPQSAGLAGFSNTTLMLITLFMFISGINVALTFYFLTGKWRQLWHDEEFKVYTLYYLGTVVICSVGLILAGNSVGTGLSYSLFHVASTISTCGFYMPRPQHWSFLVSVITFLLIFIGASAGSTGGGIKIKRLMILWKYVRNYLTRMLHPNVIFCVKIDNHVIHTDYINKIFAFIFLYLVFVIVGAFLLTTCGCSIPNSVCMAAANIGNLGPSPLINNLGGNLDYNALPILGKWTLSVLMLAGRLEIFALVAVFSPAYWRRG